MNSKVEILSPLETRRRPDGRRELISDLIVKYKGVIYTIPAGFITDYSSYPWFARALVRWSKTDIAGVFHDWLYKTGGVTRKFADQAWYDTAIAGQHSANKIQGRISWWVLRTTGWKKWNEYRNEDNHTYY